MDFEKKGQTKDTKPADRPMAEQQIQPSKEGAKVASSGKKPSITAMMGATIALGVIAYFLLSWLKPIDGAAEVAASGITADDVFAGDIHSAPAAPDSAESAGRDAAAHSAAAESPGPSETTIEMEEPDSITALDHSDSPSSDSEASAVVVEEAPAQAPMAQAEPASTTESPEQTIETARASKPASSAAEPSQAEPTPAPPSSRKSSTTSISAPSTTRSTSTQKDAEISKLIKQLGTAWWGAPQEGKLNVLFLGNTDFSKGLGLLADGRFENADSANETVVVRALSGSKIAGRWKTVDGNERMLFFPVKPGVYSVHISGGLADAQGRAYQRDSSGPIQVRP